MIDIAWCPGCGNFSILEILKSALEELNIDQKKMPLGKMSSAQLSKAHELLLIIKKTVSIQPIIDINGGKLWKKEI